MSEPIPVNPDIMRWARETAGYSIEDVVDKIDRKRVTVKVVRDWKNLPTKYSNGLWLYFSFLNHLKKKVQGSLFVHYPDRRLT